MTEKPKTTPESRADRKARLITAAAHMSNFFKAKIDAAAQLQADSVWQTFDVKAGAGNKSGFQPGVNVAHQNLDPLDRPATNPKEQLTVPQQWTLDEANARFAAEHPDAYRPGAGEDPRD